MALTKTTAIDVIDAWQVVDAGELGIGNAESVASSYGSLFYLEAAIIEATAHDGVEFIIEVSSADDEWVELTRLKGTAETPATTTINDGTVTAGDTTLTLTDATTGDFDVKGRKWFIKDGTIGNSEAVRTADNTANAVDLCQDLIRNHANSLNCYDRVDEWVVEIPFAAAQVRVLCNNVDADCDVAFTSRISKVTVL